jgi:hypothetical protein
MQRADWAAQSFMDSWRTLLRLALAEEDHEEHARVRSLLRRLPKAAVGRKGVREKRCQGEKVSGEKVSGTFSVPHLARRKGVRNLFGFRICRPGQRWRRRSPDPRPHAGSARPRATAGAPRPRRPASGRRAPRSGSGAGPEGATAHARTSSREPSDPLTRSSAATGDEEATALPPLRGRACHLEH